MRLTGGEHGGRPLRVPANGVRPTQDKVRAAIFSSLAAEVPGARVLDLFAGTGALGLEAWSRGAAWVEWVEKAPSALLVLRANLKTLDVPASAGRVVAADVFRWLSGPRPGPAYSLVLADPPYAEVRAGNWLPKLAQQLVQGEWLPPGGVWVYETEGREAPPELPGWRLARDKTYGSTRVWVWVRTA